jgi:predicted permease
VCARLGVRGLRQTRGTERFFVVRTNPPNFHPTGVASETSALVATVWDVRGKMRGCQRSRAPRKKAHQSARGRGDAAMSVALDIFVVSCKAVLKVFIIGGVGCFARRRGLLDEDSCRKMAKLNGAVFLPCLLFVALGRSVTIDHLRNVWLLPLSACVNIALGAVMGKALVRALGTPPEFRGAAVASAAFGNSLALPVVLIAAVVGAGDVGDVSFGEDAQAESLLYLGAYMTTLTVLMWTIGPVWMREGTTIAAEEEERNADVELKELVLDDAENALNASSGDSVAFVSHASVSAVENELSRGRNASRESDEEASSFPRDKRVSEARVAKTKQNRGVARFVAALGPALNANVAASLLGIFVGVVPALRHALFDENGVLFVLQDCASIIAAGAIPQVIIILGASLASGPKHDACDGFCAAGVCFIRLIGIPTVNVGLFLVLRNALPSSAVPASPAFWLTFLIEGATPTANNMMLQVQMFGSPRAADGVAALLFWQYAAAPVLLTGAVALFLAIL